MNNQKVLDSIKPEAIQMLRDLALGKVTLASDELLEVNVGFRVVKKPRSPSVDKKVLSQQELAAARAMTIDQLEFSARAKKMLSRWTEIGCVGDLADKTYSDVRKRSQSGKHIMTELAARLRELGIVVNWIEEGERRGWRYGLLAD